jgi:hypothetical protein
MGYGKSLHPLESFQIIPRYLSLRLINYDTIKSVQKSAQRISDPSLTITYVFTNKYLTALPPPKERSLSLI